MAAFCTKCGTSLELGVEHVCLAQEELLPIKVVRKWLII